MGVIIRVGVHGYAGSGKDTFADALVENYEFTKIAFADPLRDILIDTNPMLMVEDGQPVYLADVVSTLGWSEAKALYPDIRRMMVALGQSAKGRLHQRVWLNHALARAEGLDRVVFSDVRYMVEATTLKECYGAELVHIIRPGTDPANEDEALSLPPDLFKYVIRNDGDIVDLRARADMLMYRIGYRREVPEWTG
ncbi:hypothetical protein GCM10010149_88820 [Nonomuraea roseoviolacea subsp. roseoviolacea]|uniref:hypothetical protein n=1 Tax=Nonomuraea roseoviolacea TaxID=103837 RepID=UPI0031DA4F89